MRRERDSGAPHEVAGESLDRGTARPGDDEIIDGGVHTEKRSGAHRVVLVLHNTGWMPTNVSQKAIDRKAVRPLEVDIELPEGARLASGEAHLELGQLGGRARAISMLGWNVANEPSHERTRCDWVVEAPAGTRVSVTARHPRAGTCRAESVL